MSLLDELTCFPLWKIMYHFILTRLGFCCTDLEEGRTDHGNIVFITVCFSWHYVGALLLIATNYAIVYWYVVRLGMGRIVGCAYITETSQDLYLLWLTDTQFSKFH
ncbi:reticulon-1 [Platysternon megacephalum]|uniref:Reticulon-1 n=1 Tax=Platysternon megacephalum TaxID=55544 RepID=A0A4D9E8P9_9SAUR|nr:reticulon-1 [Platysternon megacephalum]